MGIISNLSNWYFSKNALPYWCIMLLDCMIIVFAGVAAQAVLHGSQPHFFYWAKLWTCSLPAFWVGMKIFHTYKGIIRFSSFVDLTRVTGALLVSVTILVIIMIAIPKSWIDYDRPNWKELLVTVTLAMIAMWSERIVVKYLYDTAFRVASAKRVFIYGVREGGVAIAKSMRNEHPTKYVVSGFVTDEEDMIGKYLLGCHVYSYSDSILEKMKARRVDTLFVSPLCNDAFVEKEDFVRELTKNNIRIMMLSGAEQWDGKTELRHSQLREVEIEDLLPREKITVDLQAIGEMLKGKRILITGAAGSIGFEMVRQVAKFEPGALILIDQAETPMHDVRLFLAKKYPSLESQTIVSSIANQTHMERLFAEYRPEYVFHAAAYKHVPMMEDNPALAVQNNVYGTRVIADHAVKYGTKKFVMISTDKAVNPTNVMGCSKRICEIYCQALNKAIQDGDVKGETQFITTRFGNVLGSNGSVIPLFKEQIRNGGPVTVTHPDIIRFFMLIPEACQLVLQAGTMGRGGEIFVFDMGKPVRIVDLAQRMIDLSGAKNIEIKFSGLRDGEKLYEEVLSEKESTKPTDNDKIRVAAVREYPYKEALKNEEELYQLSYTYDDMKIVAKMKDIVPEYKSQHSKYEELDRQ